MVAATASQANEMHGLAGWWRARGLAAAWPESSGGIGLRALSCLPTAAHWLGREGTYIYAYTGSICFWNSIEMMSSGGDTAVMSQCAPPDRLARVGAVVVAMDSANWLWPAVAATAAPHGWVASTPHVKYGPGSALLLERISFGEAPGG